MTDLLTTFGNITIPDRARQTFTDAITVAEMQPQMPDFTKVLDFIWNDRDSMRTHLIPSIDGFDVDEEVPTVCGAVTMYADFGTPEYDLCPECTA